MVMRSGSSKLKLSSSARKSLMINDTAQLMHLLNSMRARLRIF